jgi:hypothetical protein
MYAFSISQPRFNIFISLYLNNIVKTMCTHLASVYFLGRYTRHMHNTHAHKRLPRSADTRVFNKKKKNQRTRKINVSIIFNYIKKITTQ